MRHGFPLLDASCSLLPAGIGFAIEGLGYRSRSTKIARNEHFYFEDAAIVYYLHHVSGFDFARGFNDVRVAFDSTEFTGSRGEGSGLEEPRRPEPLVNSHALRSYALRCHLSLLSPRRRALPQFQRTLRAARASRVPRHPKTVRCRYEAWQEPERGLGGGFPSELLRPVGPHGTVKPATHASRRVHCPDVRTC